MHNILQNYCSTCTLKIKWNFVFSIMINQFKSNILNLLTALEPIKGCATFKFYDEF